MLLHAGVFSDSTVCGLEYYASKYPNFAETARFVKFIKNIWDIMSVKSTNKGMES